MPGTNVPKMLLAGLTILCAMPLGACEKKVLAVALKPPASLLTCSAEPVAPEIGVPGVERDRLVLAYLLAMRAAYGDCASKVAGISRWADSLPD